MNDRELLEMAAKAAGARICGWVINDPGCPRVTWTTFADEPSQAWNPLTDDGDALRLSIDLGIYPVRVGLCAEVFLNRPPHIVSWSHREPYNGDPYAATRRAIVRAASEIGNSPP